MSIANSSCFSLAWGWQVNDEYKRTSTVYLQKHILLKQHLLKLFLTNNWQVFQIHIALYFFMLSISSSDTLTNFHWYLIMSGNDFCLLSFVFLGVPWLISESYMYNLINCLSRSCTWLIAVRVNNFQWIAKINMLSLKVLWYYFNDNFSTMILVSLTAWEEIIVLVGLHSDKHIRNVIWVRTTVDF